MKTILSLANGAVMITEENGVFSLALDFQGQLGGGQAAGVIEGEGKGSVKLNAEQGVMLGEALLNAHIPASMLPLAKVIEGIANQVLKSAE